MLLRSPTTQILKYSGKSVESNSKEYLNIGFCNQWELLGLIWTEKMILYLLEYFMKLYYWLELKDCVLLRYSTILFLKYSGLLLSDRGLRRSYNYGF